ncbi:MAG TPA: rhodanese-like domain-containing protein [Methanobacteriaceae archaeon]|nr:rhodanese-like domain-containing protein [Methanobacteriaceae archaeon]
MLGSKKYEDINPQSACEIIEKNKDNPKFILLDVRNPQEYSEAHIEGSTLINYQSPNFNENVEKLDKNKTYLIYCRSGVRSAGAAKTMAKLGFKNLYNMVGGITAWGNSGLPLK